MAVDDRGAQAQGITAPLIGGEQAVPSKDPAHTLTKLSRAVMVGTDGDVAAQTSDESDIVLPQLNAGVVYPIRIKRVAVTGTTATNIVALR